MNNWFRLGSCGALSLVMLLLGAGCSTTSAFRSYTGQITPHITNVKTGQIETSLGELDKRRDSRDKVLYLMERGRIAQIGGFTDISREDFEQCIAAIRAQEDRAVISAGEKSAQASSLLVNENVIPYEATGYEKILVYHLQALNYLFDGNLTGAGVEVRRANLEQEIALEQHHKELAKARKKAEEEKVNRERMNENLDDVYSVMDEVAGQVKNSFQNAYTFYFSGVVWEMMGEDNDAYIDYKKAIEIYPENQYLQRDVIRLAQKLRMRDDLAGFKKQFGESAVEPAKVDDSGEVVVLFESGFVPQRQEVQIPLPTPWGVVSTAFPIYRVKPRPMAPLTVTLRAGTAEVLGDTQPICDVRALAVKSLKERVPILAMREILRVASQAGIQKVARDEGGLAGSILSSAYNIVASNADLRAWYTLPDNAQMARFTVPAGEQTLLLHSPVGSDTVDVTVVPGKVTMLRVLGTGPRLYCQAISF